MQRRSNSSSSRRLRIEEEEEEDAETETEKRNLGRWKEWDGTGEISMLRFECTAEMVMETGFRK